MPPKSEKSPKKVFEGYMGALTRHINAVKDLIDFGENNPTQLYIDKLENYVKKIEECQENIESSGASYRESILDDNTKQDYPFLEATDFRMNEFHLSCLISNPLSG